MQTDTTRVAVLWLLNGSTAKVDLEAFECEHAPDESAAAWIATATGLKVTIQTMRQTTIEPAKD